MDRQRVVGVRGTDASGSGYVIAARLVVTSAHVVGPVGTAVEVLRLADGRPYRARVAWCGTPAGRDDAALVVVDDENWQPPPGRSPRWGRTVTMRPGLECAAWGFPDFAQHQSQQWETAQPSGTLNPGDRYVGDRYVMSVAAGQQPATRDDGLFAGRLLVGVVVADPASHDHTRLETIPAYVLRHDRGFRSVLAEHGDRAMTLTPVEWESLLPVRAPEPQTVASLLVASQAVVPFHGRDTLLAQLEDWAEDEGFGARLVCGPGGQGKTRLAHELGDRLSDRGWEVLWLNSKATATDLRILSDAAVPLLIVVDYAESRTTQLPDLLEQCAQHPLSTSVKLLMLARTTGTWRQELFAKHPNLAPMIDTNPIELPPLEQGAEARAIGYHQAVRAFAAQLPTIPDQADVAWSNFVNTLPTPSDNPALAVALTLHMTALADLLDAAHGVEPGTRYLGIPVEERLLRHEKHYWQTTARDRTLLPAMSTASLHDALAASLLVEVRTQNDADDLLRRPNRLSDTSNDRRATIRDWIATLYPPVEEGQPWGRLQPDRLAEHFVAELLSVNPTLADELAHGATGEQLTHLLTVYSRAATHPGYPRLPRQLTDLCVRRADVLAVPAILTVPQLESPQPVLDALHETVRSTTSIGQLNALYDAFPEHTHVLADLAVLITQNLVAKLRKLAEIQPSSRDDLAASLNNLANRLAQTGQHEEALATIAEAVTIRRQLFTQQPDAYRPHLAMSLNNLAADLAQAGQHQEALTAITEAAELYRQLATQQPDTYQPDLAMSLNNLAIRLGEAGQHQEALTAITEAAELYRQLATQQPDTYRPHLAMSLNNLAVQLAQAGQHQEALTAITEAVTIRRQLAAQRPDTYRPQLATSLNNLAIQLGAVKRRGEALVAINEAIEIRRKLTAARPAAHQQELDESLNVANWLKRTDDKQTS